MPGFKEWIMMMKFLTLMSMTGNKITMRRKNNDAKDYEYKKIDTNELADIIQEPNKFQVPT